jgi:hypothetical protein
MKTVKDTGTSNGKHCHTTRHTHTLNRKITWPHLQPLGVMGMCKFLVHLRVGVQASA